VKLLLDEMYPAAIAEQLRGRGHDVVSIHDLDYRRLEGAPDEDVFATAVSEQRAIVTENVPDFRRLGSEAIAAGLAHSALVFTTNRQFPRGDRDAIGRLMLALDALLAEGVALPPAIFLKPRAKQARVFGVSSRSAVRQQPMYSVLYLEDEHNHYV
jgi:Domain of unknown function (DUF5615)